MTPLFGRPSVNACHDSPPGKVVTVSRNYDYVCLNYSRGPLPFKTNSQSHCSVCIASLACVSTRTFFLLSHARSTNRHMSSTTQHHPRLVSSISVAPTSIGEQSRPLCLGIPFAAHSRINGAFEECIRRLGRYDLSRTHPFRHACRWRRCPCGSADEDTTDEEAGAEEAAAKEEATQ